MSQPFPSLERLQSLFMRLIAAPEGVAKGCEALAREGVAEAEDLSALIATDSRLDSVEHLDIYADMYFYRLLDCLAEDFPRLAHHVGTDQFHNLVTDYLLAHPPSHFSLRELGRALPSFLEDHLLAAARPWLGDLARLEWARVDVFDETNAAPLDREALLHGAADSPGAFHLQRIPASRLLQLRGAAITSWKENEVPTEALENSSQLVSALVWRKGFAIYHRSLENDEAECLRALAEDRPTVEGLAELLITRDGDGAAATNVSERLAALLDRWCLDEIVTCPDTN